MCTVVFIPADNKYFFGSLRDESPKRMKAVEPDLYSSTDSDFLCPKDPVAGGTWIGVTGLGITLILLNGGFINHLKKKQYRKSRGLIVAELLESTMPVIDWCIMNLEDIEPFTLIVWDHENLFQLVWDGTQKHRVKLDTTISHLWSSATLYKKETRAHRESLFQNWIAKNHPVSNQSALNFFKSFTDHENGFIMNRNNEIKTLSYTFIELEVDNKATMDYYDLTNYNFCSKTISLARNEIVCALPPYLQNNQYL